MQPTINIDTSAKTLNVQVNPKFVDLEEIMNQDYHFSDKTWLFCQLIHSQQQ